MASIFLSYAREDRRFAVMLARLLESSGHQVWWDRRLDGGEEFAAEIEAELDKSDVVVVAWSKESVKSRWVRDEAAVGGDRGILVPISIDGSLPPMGFRQFHTLELTGWKGAKRDERTAELLHSIDRRVNGKATAPVAAPIAAQANRFAWSSRTPLGAVAAAFVLVIAAGLGVFLLSGRSSDRGPPPRPTIALLPFTATSQDSELRDIAAQTRESISHTLSQTGLPVRLLSSKPADSRKAGDFLLSGELSRRGETITATIHVDEALHGVTIATQNVEADTNDVRNLPERIGVHMADFFGSNLTLLDRRNPLDPALIAEMLSGQVGNYIENYQIMKRAVAKAPDEPQALLGLAFFTGLALPELPRDERQQAVNEARRAAEKALKLAPQYGDAYAARCLLRSETRMAECEDDIRAGSRIDPDQPWLRAFLAELMQRAGRFDEAAELSNLAYAHDPYSFMMIRPMLRMLEFKRDAEVLGDLVPQAERWYPGGKPSFFRNRLYGLLYQGDFEAIQRLEGEDLDVLPPGYVRSGAIASAIKSKSLPALRKICAPATPDDYLLAVRCLIAFAMIGDQDGAYALSDKLYARRVGRTPEETEQIWLNDPGGGGPVDYLTSPAAAPMRRDPRYLALAQRTGLLDYWRTGRRPDFCTTKPEPVCAGLLKRK